MKLILITLIGIVLTLNANAATRKSITSSPPPKTVGSVTKSFVSPP
jgi:hypothetical protein